ncbi:MAG: phosphatidylserine decarboxylase family protein [candidate division Zixibacteria bacterium]|nr:phosphatidylserine decarboxylase family protein [candidate division Zixibacteria bacterium]MCI0596794.1 phosphatidylserine decarboxylase family protein [candidate division Zixibacteria bacterium]
MAKDGWPFVWPFAALALLSFAAAFKSGRPGLWFLSFLLLFLTLFFAYFFRDPERKIPSDDNLILSPADGKVVAIEAAPEPLFLKSQAQKISIFLSPLDVHINRIPASGKVDYFSYLPGKFLAAYKDKASTDNEQTAIGISTSFGKILFKQIAGVLARRIVCRLKLGKEVKAGEKFGMIRFGSRVDIFLPEELELKVQKGDKVTGGETIMADAKTLTSKPEVQTPMGAKK